MNKEKRNITSTNANIRAYTSTGTTERFIEGYASVFNEPSRQIVEVRNGKVIQYTEVIEPTAFNSALQSPDLNVIHTVNHDPSKMVARTKSGTLQLSVDDVGLKYRFSVPNTSTGNDLYEMVQRGDLFESSFAFNVSNEGEKWTKNVDGSIYRYISNISNLFDTSTVTEGAYANTNVNVVSRALTDLIEKEELVLDANTIDADFQISLLKSKKI